MIIWSDILSGFSLSVCFSFCNIHCQAQLSWSMSYQLCLVLLFKNSLSSDLASLECLFISILCPLMSAGGSQFILCLKCTLSAVSAGGSKSVPTCVCWRISIYLVLTMHLVYWVCWGTQFLCAHQCTTSGGNPNLLKVLNKALCVCRRIPICFVLTNAPRLGGIQIC